MLMCGGGAKPVSHLMKFHLLQWEVAKVKFLMNSNMNLTVLNLHQKTDPKVQQDFKGQGHYGKVKGQIYNPPPMSLPCINFLHLTVSEIWPGQDFIGQGHYGKVKSRSHHDAAHVHPLTNVPTTYQLHTPYGF